MAVNLPRAAGRRPARAEATTPRKATTEGILDGHLADEGADDLEDDISVIGDFAHGRQEQPLLRCWQLITIVILFTSSRKPRLRPRLISTSQNSFPAERMTRQPAGSIKNVDAIVVRADRPTTLDEAHPGDERTFITSVLQFGESRDRRAGDQGEGGEGECLRHGSVPFVCVSVPQ